MNRGAMSHSNNHEVRGRGLRPELRMASRLLVHSDQG